MENNDLTKIKEFNNKKEQKVFSNLDLKNQSIVSLNLTKVSFHTCNFQAATLTAITFDECEFIDCNFDSATLEDITFKNKCHFDKCSFKETTFNDSTYDDKKIQNPEILGSSNIFESVEQVVNENDEVNEFILDKFTNFEKSSDCQEYKLIDGNVYLTIVKDEAGWRVMIGFTDGEDILAPVITDVIYKPETSESINNEYLTQLVKDYVQDICRTTLEKTENSINNIINKITNQTF